MKLLLRSDFKRLYTMYWSQGYLRGLFDKSNLVAVTIVWNTRETGDMYAPTCRIVIWPVLVRTYHNSKTWWNYWPHSQLSRNDMQCLSLAFLAKEIIYLVINISERIVIMLMTFKNTCVSFAWLCKKSKIKMFRVPFIFIL